MATDDTKIPAGEFDFNSVLDKLDALDNQIIPEDPTDIISDLDKPVYIKKRSKKGVPVADTGKRQIKDSIKREFDRSNRKRASDIQPQADGTATKRAVLANLSSSISQSKTLSKAVAAKVKTTLPSSLYTKLNTTIPSVDASRITDTSSQISAALNQQTEIAIDSTIRDQTSDIIRDRINRSEHIERRTLLANILNSTQQSQSFFENTFRKYLMTDIELKFRHILVSKDILQHTKLLIETISAKLDSVKHNTSLSEVAKISAWGELKRSMRLKANAAITDAAIAPFKDKLNDLTKKAVHAIQGKIATVASGAGSSSFEYEETDTSDMSSISKLATSARNKIIRPNKAFSDPDMHQFGEDNKLLKSIGIGNIPASIRPDAFASGDSEKAQFDAMAHKSLVDIIPSFLSKIFQQSETISKILAYSTRNKLSKSKQSDFNKSIQSNELRFDKTTGNIADVETVSSNIKASIFGTKESRTEALQPIVNTLNKSFKEHGGNESMFKNALPDIVKFIVNIAKHAQVVKLSHIKKYLNGEQLDELEQKYMDAMLVDIPEASRKGIIEILGTAFFKDGEVDKQTTGSMGKLFDKLKDVHKADAAMLQKTVASGENRYLTDIFDPATGAVNHTNLRSQRAAIDIDTLRGNLDKEYVEEPTMTEQVKNKAQSVMDEKLHPALKKVKDAIPTVDDLNDTKIAKLAKSVSASVAEAFSKRTNIPNRDSVQISGPGVYLQGVDKELHIPLTEKKGTQPPPIPKDKVDDPLISIRDMLKQQFEIANGYDDTKIQVANQMLVQLSKQGLSPEEAKAQLPLWARIVKAPFSLGKKTGGFGGKLVSAYFKGVTGFYGGLFGMARKLIGKPKMSQAKGLLGGIGSAIKGTAGLATSLLGTLLGFEVKAIGKVLGGTLSTTRKLFSMKNKFVDVYRKDEINLKNPLLKGVQIKAQDRYVFANGAPVPDSYSITEAVFDNTTNQLVITDEDIQHGLVDNKNKRLVKSGLDGLGTSLIKKSFKAAGALIRGGAKITKGVVGFYGELLSSLVTGIFGKRTSKKKKGEPTTVDTTNLTNLVTNHLIAIKELITPISKHFKAMDVREGSYADYKRDRDVEKDIPKTKRARDILKENKTTKDTKADLKKSAAAAGILAMLGSALGFGGDEEGEDGSSGGGGLVAGVGGTLAGGYAVNKVKGLFTKKVAEEAIQQTAKKGMMRSAASAIGRTAVAQGGRSMAVSGAAALGTAASAPAIGAGLAVAGLGGGYYALYSWADGKERRTFITRVRNNIYRVPDDKMPILIKFEDALAEVMDNSDGLALDNNDLYKFIKDFGFNPSDENQLSFFKYWYSLVFYPIFKASYDLFKESFKVEFKDQTSLKDNDLNRYKASLEETSVYAELQQIDISLSKEGFKLWMMSDKPKEIVDDKASAKKAAQAREELVKNNLANKNKTYSGEADTMGKAAEEQKLDMMVGFGMPSFDISEDTEKKKEVELSDGGTDYKEAMSSKRSQYKTQALEYKPGSKMPKGLHKGWEKTQVQIIDQLIGLGWTKEQAIGITSNIERESTGNPEALGDGGKAYGIAQWHPDRQANFKKWSGKDIRGSSVAEQVAFMNYELRKGQEKGAGKKLAQAKSAGEAAGIVSRYYERPGDMAGEMSYRAGIASRMEKTYKPGAEPEESQTGVAGTPEGASNPETGSSGTTSVEQPTGAPVGNMVSKQEPSTSTAPASVEEYLNTPKTEPFKAVISPSSVPVTVAQSAPKSLSVPVNETAEQQAARIHKDTNDIVNYQMNQITSGEAAKKEAEYQRKKALRKTAEAQFPKGANELPLDYVNRIDKYLIENTPSTTNQQIDNYSNAVKPPVKAPEAPKPIIDKTTVDQTTASTTPTEVTINDPESKTQTGLLSEQNRLLGELVALMGKSSSSPNISETASADIKPLLDKMDTLVASLSGANVLGSSMQSSPSSSSSRTIQKPPPGSGIDVSRVS